MAYPPDPLDIRLSRAPDLIEPFVAWRVWGVCIAQGKLHLDSLYRSATWPVGGPLVAGCEDCHDSPCSSEEAERHHGGGHGCGIYAAKHLGLATIYMPDWVRSRTSMVQRRCTLVIGRAELFGVVKEHELGYRAQKARPVEVFVPVCFGAYDFDARTAARLIGRHYGISTHLFRRTRDLEDA